LKRKKKSAHTLPSHLSRREIQQGQRVFQRYITINGFTIAFLMNDLLILYGIRNGLSDPQLAVLASFMHLTMPFMFIGKKLIPRYGLAKMWSTAWFLRYLSGSILILAPFVGRVAPQWAVSFTVLAAVFGFSLLRSIGLTANSPMLGEITTSRDRGRFISGNWMRAQASNLFSMVLVIIIMRYSSELWVYQILIGVGCLVGFYGSSLLAQLPETSAPSLSAQKPILESLIVSFLRPRYRRTMIAWAAGFSIFVLVVPFSIILIKNGYGISDHTALMFSLLMLVGGVVAALISSVISDRVGPRPLILIYAAGFFVVTGYWALAPAGFHPVVAGLVFFLQGFCKTGINVGTSHYFLSMADVQDRVGTSMFGRMFSGAAAGIAGSVVGGGILTILRGQDLSGLPLYRSYFLVVLVLLVPLYFSIFRLDRLKEWRVTSILSLLFSMRDIRAIYVMNRLEQSSDAEDDLLHVQRLEQIASSLSEPALRSLLDSPRLSVRVHALRALREIDFGSRTAEALIRELKCGEFTSAWNAAEILGHHRIEAAVPALREGLESTDPFLVGKCMVALVQLGDRVSRPRILELFREAENPRIIIHGANALVESGEPEGIIELLEKLYTTPLYGPVADELLNAVATLCGAERDFYRFLREYNSDPEQGFGILQSELEHLTGRVFDEPAKDRILALPPGELWRETMAGAGSIAGPEEKQACLGFVRDFVLSRSYRPSAEDFHFKLLACLAMVITAAFESGAVAAEMNGEDQQFSF
jgi:hypothetical protein